MPTLIFVFQRIDHCVCRYIGKMILKSFECKTNLSSKFCIKINQILRAVKQTQSLFRLNLGKGSEKIIFKARNIYCKAARSLAEIGNIPAEGRSVSM